MASRPPAQGRSFTPGALKRRLVIADLVAIATAFAIAFAVQEVFRPVPVRLQLLEMAVAVASLPLWMLGMVSTRLYIARANERPADEARHILVAALVGTSGIVAIAFAVQFGQLSRLWTLTTFAVATILLLLERTFARRRFTHLRATRQMARRVVIVGTDRLAVQLAEVFEQHPQAGYQAVGFLGDGADGGTATPLLGAAGDAERVLAEQGATGVVISVPSVDRHTVNMLTRSLTDAGYHVAISSGLLDIDVTRLRPQQVDGHSMLYVEPTIRGGWRRHAKRVFDLTLAAFGLLVTAPLILLAMALIRLESRGPVLFRQQRVGIDGSSFEMIKLRTMVPDAEQRRDQLLDLNEGDGPLFKIREDPRITRVGRVLRRLSIDELPQFWNVLRGDMSIVGPRPALPHEVAQWPPVLRGRLRVLPGITGLWQVSGRADTTFEDYARLDLYYVDNWSLAHDLRIVRKTFGAVLHGGGAS